MRNKRNLINPICIALQYEKQVFRSGERDREEGEDGGGMASA